MEKEIIEEMAKDIFNTCAWRFGNPSDYKEICNDIAKDLIKLDYRNCKDKVVLSKEEYAEYVELRNSEVGELVKENRQLGKQCLDWMKLYHKQLTKTDQARKETAKEILKKMLANAKRLKEQFNSTTYGKNKEHLIATIEIEIAGIKNLAKQYGVEE